MPSRQLPGAEEYAICPTLECKSPQLKKVGKRFVKGEFIFLKK